MAAYQDRTTSDAQIVSIPDWSDWQVDGTLTVEGYKKFQFQIGPIGSPALLQFPFLISRFNSRLVRLAAPPQYRVRSDSPRFNSRLVRLAGSATCYFPGLHLRFNSRLVRLAVSDFIHNIHNVIKFQFQIGPIGSLYPGVHIHRHQMFQFQIGPIGRSRSTKNHRRIRSFNSRLVRLAVTYECIMLIPSEKFQFQIGPIGRPPPISQRRCNDPFQFQIGPIGSTIHEPKEREISVSIPDWSDWQIRLHPWSFQ